MTNHPEIWAKFEMESDGTPITHDFKGIKHYRIKLSVEGAPESAYAVTYRLHDTFLDPVREVRKADQASFSEDILTYGNFTVQAKLRTKEGAVQISGDLAEALKKSYGKHASPIILKAIDSISKL